MRDILASFSSVILQADPSGMALEPLVFAAWKRCVDGALGENVIPIRLEDKRLIAAVTSETWRKQVADLGPILAEKLNAVLGSQAVKYIRFEVDPDAVQEYRRLVAKMSEAGVGDGPASLGELSGKLESAAEQIRDEHLRRLFLEAAAGSLGRQKQPGKAEAGSTADVEK